MDPYLVVSKRVYEDSRLGVHTKGPWIFGL